MIEFESLDGEAEGEPAVGSEAGEKRAQFAHDKAREGIEHLQAAAREIIAAARAALDVAEELVDDPDTVASLTGMAGNVTGAVSDLVRSVVPGWRPGASRSDDTSGDDGDEPKIQRIPVT